MVSHSRIMRLGCMIALVCVTVSVHGDEDDNPWGALLDMGAQLLQRMDQYEIDLQAIPGAPKPEDWKVFWNAIEDALQSESVEDLAWLLPEAKRALSYLDAVPSAKPYADWLRQRLDYFEVSREAEKLPPPPAPPPTAPGPIVPPRRVEPAEPKPPKPAPPVIREQATWEKKLSSRRKPANADALVPGLKRVFNEERIPAELVWLAEVESTMNPSARSPVGAVGLFQMMPATAQRFGLRTTPSDERLIADKNARAAAQYLRLLHGQFGSWPLALAAYNAGEGRVGRTMKSKGGKTFEDIAPHLPVETQMYVPKVMATVSLREGIKAREVLR